MASLAFRAFGDERPVMTIDGREVSADEFQYLYTKNKSESSVATTPREYANLFALFKMKVMEAEACGIDTTASFKQELEYYYSSIPADDQKLRNEYRDGMLLFEISDRRVWQKSVNDIEGLGNFFDANRDRYAWDVPRAKGWMIFAHDNETACEVCTFLESIRNLAEDIRMAIRDRYGRDVMAVRFLVKEGVNDMIDALVFNRDVEFAHLEGWEAAKPFKFKVISEPEDWKDVKGSVTTDYQQLLSDEWEKELWENHTVEFNYDVIDEMAD